MLSKHLGFLLTVMVVRGKFLIHHLIALHPSPLSLLHARHAPQTLKHTKHYMQSADNEVVTAKILLPSLRWLRALTESLAITAPQDLVFCVSSTTTVGSAMTASSVTISALDATVTMHMAASVPCAAVPREEGRTSESGTDKKRPRDDSLSGDDVDEARCDSAISFAAAQLCWSSGVAPRLVRKSGLHCMALVDLNPDMVPTQVSDGRTVREVTISVAHRCFGEALAALSRCHNATPDDDDIAVLLQVSPSRVCVSSPFLALRRMFSLKRLYSHLYLPATRCSGSSSGDSMTPRALSSDVLLYQLESPHHFIALVSGCTALEATAGESASLQLSVEVAAKGPSLMAVVTSSAGATERVVFSGSCSISDWGDSVVCRRLPRAPKRASCSDNVRNAIQLVEPLRFHPERFCFLAHSVLAPWCKLHANHGIVLYIGYDTEHPLLHLVLRHVTTEALLCVTCSGAE